MRHVRPIPLAGSELNGVRHVCALFHDDEEEYGITLPFVQDGLACGHRAVHIVNPDQRPEHLQRLSSVGIDTITSQRSGQLEVRSNSETYLNNGRFDPDRMLNAFAELASERSRPDVQITRFICRMDWAADGRTHVDNLVKFESLVNDLWRRSDDVVICTYRLNQFSGDAIIDIVRTHPYVIIGGILRQNPFFVPPEQFLPELRARRGIGLSAANGRPK